MTNQQGSFFQKWCMGSIFINGQGDYLYRIFLYIIHRLNQESLPSDVVWLLINFIFGFRWGCAPWREWICDLGIVLDSQLHWQNRWNSWSENFAQLSPILPCVPWFVLHGLV